MIRKIGAAAILGVLSVGSRRFAGTAPSIPDNAVVYEIGLGVFEAERTDSGEVIIYENDQ
ncbi:hypothetical protein O162_20035 [Pseudomonas putida SJ3]|nr:hypothetical protein O162_20035 [Pseudomonas putida SJ3]